MQKLIVAFFVFFQVQILFAGTVHTQLDHDEGGLGEAFGLTITISGDLSGKLELPQIPDVEVSGTGTSTSLSIINGSMSKETSYNFSLEPQKEGTFTIPPIKVQVDGEWLATDQVVIKVYAGGAAAPQRRQAPRQGVNPFGQGQGNPGPSDETNEDQASPNLFIERDFSKKSMFEGEPIVVTTKIFHRNNIANIEANNEKPSGFRVLDIKQFNSQEQRGNVTYSVIAIKQTLVPLRSGKLTIAPFRIKASVIMQSAPSQRQRRGGSPFDEFFDDFFNGARQRVVKRVVASPEATLDVKALPSQGKPNGFQELVGSFRIASELNQTDLKAGDTVTLTVTVDGVGALDSMVSPDLHLGPNFRVYPDKAQLTEKPGERYGLESSKVFRYALVPLQKGDYKLGELKIPYFDPSAGVYQDLKVDLGSLKVAEGDMSQAVVSGPAPQVSSGGVGRLDVKSLANDLVDIHRNESMSRSQVLSKEDFLPALLMLGIPGLFCGFLLLLSLLRKSSGSSHLVRKKAAYRNFEKSMSSWSKESDRDGVLKKSYGAYRNFLGERFGFHGAALTGKELAQEMMRTQVPPSVLSELESLEFKLEQTHYAGGSLSQNEAERLIEQIKQLAREIEKTC